MEFWSVAKFYGRIKGIHVYVQDVATGIIIAKIQLPDGAPDLTSAHVLILT
jgi:hypothetical protein